MSWRTQIDRRWTSANLNTSSQFPYPYTMGWGEFFLHSYYSKLLALSQYWPEMRWSYFFLSLSQLVEDSIVVVCCNRYNAEQRLQYQLNVTWRTVAYIFLWKATKNFLVEIISTDCALSHTHEESWSHHLTLYHHQDEMSKLVQTLQ